VKAVFFGTLSVFVFVFFFFFEMVAQCWLSRSDKVRSRETKIQGEEEPALLNNSDLGKLFSWNLVCLCLCHGCPVLAIIKLSKSDEERAMENKDRALLNNFC